MAKAILILICTFLGLQLSANDSTNLNEAKAFGISVMEALMERDTENYYQAFNDSFVISSEGKMVLKDSAKNILRDIIQFNSPSTKIKYLDSFRPVVFSVAFLTDNDANWEKILENIKNYSPLPKDYIYLGLMSLKYPARNQPYNELGSMFVLRKVNDKWKIIVLLE